MVGHKVLALGMGVRISRGEPNMERISWNEYWFNIARIVSTRATCPRKQVGCVIISNNRILATGYNGSRQGEPHCTSVGCDIRSNHCKRAVHAEINAIDQYLRPQRAIRILDSGLGLEMYCTLQPCKKCVKEINKYLPDMKIYYEEEYDNR